MEQGYFENGFLDIEIIKANLLFTAPNQPAKLGHFFNFPWCGLLLRFCFSLLFLPGITTRYIIAACGRIEHPVH